MSNKIVVQRPETQVIDVWHSELEKKVKNLDYAQTTVETYKKGMEKFWIWLFENNVTMVTPDVIEKWKTYLVERKTKPTAINTWLAGVRKFYDWAVSNEIIVANPTLSVKSIKRKKSNKHHLREKLSDVEVLRLLSIPDRKTTIGKRDYAILCIKAYVPIRDVELHRADLADLTTIDGKPVLYVQGKGSTEKDEPKVIYNPQAQNALYDWLAERKQDPGALFTSLSPRSTGERLSLSAMRHIIKHYYGVAGIFDKRKTSHSMRHTAITKIVKKAGILKAKEAAGHASIETTMIYTHEESRLSDPGEAYIDYSEQ